MFPQWWRGEERMLCWDVSTGAQGVRRKGNNPGWGCHAKHKTVVLTCTQKSGVCRKMAVWVPQLSQESCPTHRTIAPSILHCNGSALLLLSHISLPALLPHFTSNPRGELLPPSPTLWLNTSRGKARDEGVNYYRLSTSQVCKWLPVAISKRSCLERERKKEKERGLLYNHHYFICRVYTMENKSQGTRSQIISVSLMVWKSFCFYRGKTNVNSTCVCLRAHATPFIAKGRAVRSRNKKWLRGCRIYESVELLLFLNTSKSTIWHIIACAALRSQASPPAWPSCSSTPAPCQPTPALGTSRTLHWHPDLQEPIPEGSNMGSPSRSNSGGTESEIRGRKSGISWRGSILLRVEEKDPWHCPISLPWARTRWAVTVDGGEKQF